MSSVTERVVDLLEAVEVDVEQRDAGFVAGRGGALAEETVEIAAIGQARQGIVQRGMLDAGGRGDELGVAGFGFGPGALEVALDGDVGGNVPVAADDAGRAVGLAIADADLAHDALGAVSQPETIFRDVAGAIAHGSIELVFRTRQIVGVDRLPPVIAIARPAVARLAVKVVHAVVPNQLVGLDVVFPDPDLRRIEGKPEPAGDNLELVLALAQSADVAGALVDQVAGDEQRNQHEGDGQQ
jgi:hypothetical protein